MSLLGLLPRIADWRMAKRSWRADLLAGVTVAIVALPLALAFGVTSGLGAQAGLVTAIIAGAVAAIFGGSNLQVSGPTGAMTVVLVPVVAQFGPGGVFMVGVMAGVMLIVLAVAKLGRLVRFLPLPVIEGFTAGIAVVIALQQVPAALGIADAEGDKVWLVAFNAAREFFASPQHRAAADGVSRRRRNVVRCQVAAGAALLTVGGNRGNRRRLDCRARCRTAR